MTPISEDIKNAIARLHEKGSGDYESLVRQVQTAHKTVTLNIPQAMAAMASHKNLYLEWARGTGKTTFLGYRAKRITEQMPRCTGLLIGPSYNFLLSRIVPSLVQGLEMFGLYQDLHYFIGKQPPLRWRSGWTKAYQPPEKWNNYITFWNGVGFHLISHDLPDDGRGLNTDVQIGDEAAILDPKKLEANTNATLRGTNVREFRDIQLFGASLFVSSTPITPEGQWFIEREELAKSNPKEYAFISATSRYNKQNLMAGYLEKAREEALSEYIYLAEYENVRPKFTKDGFYGLLDPDEHLYTAQAPRQRTFNSEDLPKNPDCSFDTDLIKALPLILSIDWGGAINCLTVNQHIASLKEYRTLKSMYVLGEDQKIQDDLFNDFHAYYKLHQTSNKNIYLWYDASGNHRTGNTRFTRAEQARQQLIALGWHVHLMDPHRIINVIHEDKHLLWETILRGDHPALPRYRMNRHNAKDCYISMKFAKTKLGSRGEVKKNKSSEKSAKRREHATDLSDANDIALFGMFYHLLRYGSSSLPGIRAVSG